MLELGILFFAIAVLLAVIVFAPRRADAPTTARRTRSTQTPTHAPDGTPLPVGIQKALSEALAGARAVGIDDVASEFQVVDYLPNGDCVGIQTYADRLNRVYVQKLHVGDTITPIRQVNE